MSPPDGRGWPSQASHPNNDTLAKAVAPEVTSVRAGATGVGSDLSWDSPSRDYLSKLSFLPAKEDRYLEAVVNSTVSPNPKQLPETHARWAAGHYLPYHDCPECQTLRRRPRRWRRAA